MTKVAVPMTRANLSPSHAVAAVGVLDHTFRLERLGEARPTRAAVELVNRGKQRLTRHNIDVDARLLVIQILPGPGVSVPFCCVTRYSSGESLEMASGSLLNFLISFSSCRTCMEGTPRVRAARLAQVAVVERFLRPTQLSHRNQPGASLSFFTSRLVNLLEPTAYLSNVVNCAPSSATCTASSLAGSFALAFSLTRWRLPGGSKKLSPAL